MSVSVTDESANTEKIIQNAINIIGKSKDKLTFFKVVYNGKLNVKKQDYVMNEGNFSSTKRVLELGKSFVTGKVVKAIKDENKKIAYQKKDIYSQHKQKIISTVEKKLKHLSHDTVSSKKFSKKSKSKKWDVFVSHAYQDKTIAAPFVQTLKENDIKVWYDTDILQWGDSLTDSINKGLKNSLFGLVILSKTFFKKKWTNAELQALMSLAHSKENMGILPLFYKISHEEIVKKYPLLADFYGRSWDEGFEKLTNEIKKLVKKRRK